MHFINIYACIMQFSFASLVSLHLKAILYVLLNFCIRFVYGSYLQVIGRAMHLQCSAVLMLLELRANFCLGLQTDKLKHLQ